MNKYDWILIGICVLLFGIYYIYPKEKASTVLVYRNDTLVLEAPLDQDQTYEVEGKLGTVQIVIENHGVMVEKETSPKHYCSKQGFIYETHEMIVCLPNELVIQIEGTKKIDAVVK